MSSTLLTLLLGAGLTALAVVSTPLAARLTHSVADPESGFFTTTILGLLITALYGIGAICVILGASHFGKTAGLIAVPAYLIGLLVVTRLAWATLGPDRAQRHSATRTPGGTAPAGA